MINCSDICSNSCLGKQNYHGGCCSIEDKNWIIGPVNDTSEFLERLGGDLKYEDIFIDHEEGSKLFPDKRAWQDRGAYPALRININSERKFCMFYNQENKSCGVYDIRPKVCQNYFCKHLKDIFGPELEF